MTTLPDTAPDPHFDMLDLEIAISQMRTKSAPGPDQIELMMVKKGGRLLLEKLIHLYNACLDIGKFPNSWKQARVITILKSPDKDVADPGSYRPICLLPVLGKVLEKLLLNRMRTVFDDGSSALQFGFKPGFSTIDAIEEVQSFTRQARDTYVLAIFFDIRGAFDNVWWPYIFRGLKDRTCPKNLYVLILDCFRSRSASIVEKHASVRRNLNKGCPQGSILGPKFWSSSLVTVDEF